MTKERKFAYLMAGLCGVSVASAIGSYIQHKRTASLLKKTVKELAEATPVEIEKEVVDEVIQEALEMKVDNQVDDILEETKKEIKSQISRTVITAVSAEMGKCVEDLKKEIMNYAFNVNRYDGEMLFNGLVYLKEECEHICDRLDRLKWRPYDTPQYAVDIIGQKE